MRDPMNISRLFVLRPVATSLLMIALVLVGLVAVRFLPISSLPDVDYPTIQVQTFYPGASPQVMATTVTAPLEVQLGEIPGLQQMTSSSSAGASVITLQFDLSLNLDVAEQNVQEAINAANSLLPTGLPAPPTYAKVNPADQPILTLAVTSNSMSLTQLQDVANNRLGVENFRSAGGRPGDARRRQRAGGQGRSGSAEARRLRTQYRRSALAAREHQRQPAQGQFRRPGSRLHHQRQRSDPGSQGLSEYGDLLSERRAGVPARCRAVTQAAQNTEQGAWYNQHAGDRAQCACASPAPT